MRDAATGTRVTYSPKVFIPLTMLCRDRCGYCTFAQPPARLESPYLSPDQVLAIARAGAAGGVPRGAVHPRRAAGGALPGGGRVAGRQRVRLHRRLPGRHVPAGARRDGPAAPRQRRRPVRRRAGRSAAGRPQPGDDGRDAAGRPGRPPRSARQAARASPGHPRRRRPSRHPVHHRHPRRHRRGPGRSARRARGHRRRPPPPRPRAGGDRPELPAEAGHGDAPGRAVPARRPPRSHRPGPPRAPARGARAGAAQPGRRLRRAARRRHRRLGRRVAGDGRPREPRAAVAGARPAARGHRGPRLRAGPPPDDLPRVRGGRRPLARPRPRVPGRRPGRRRGPRARRPRLGVPRAHARERQGGHRAPRSCSPASGRPPGTRAPTPSPPPWSPGPSGPSATRRSAAGRPRSVRAGWPRCSTACGPARRSARTRSSPCSPPAGPRWSPWPRWPTSCAARRWATPSRSSATATSTTRTCARSSASSAGSPRARSRSTCGARPYLLTLDDIAQRSREAWEIGATEVCLQGGIHPDFDGDYYIDVARAVKEAVPDIHVHGFTALEVTEGAKRLGEPLDQYLRRLMDAGLRSLPGTAAEILDDAVRADPVPRQDHHRRVARAPTAPPTRWACARTSRSCSARSSRRVSWARHLLRTRALQAETGGFTEFVGLPFVHMATPLYLQRKARRGPTFREVLLMHAVARIAYRGLIDNIQFSWVKLGRTAGMQLLQAGCNDLGGTLMDENISPGRRRQPRPGDDGRRLPRHGRAAGAHAPAAHHAVRPGRRRHRARLTRPTSRAVPPRHRRRHDLDGGRHRPRRPGRDGHAGHPPAGDPVGRVPDRRAPPGRRARGPAGGHRPPTGGTRVQAPRGRPHAPAARRFARVGRAVHGPHGRVGGGPGGGDRGRGPGVAGADPPGELGRLQARPLPPGAPPRGPDG